MEYRSFFNPVTFHGQVSKHYPVLQIYLFYAIRLVCLKIAWVDHLNH